jgi:AcrR family transcriptional regulator
MLLSDCGPRSGVQFFRGGKGEQLTSGIGKRRAAAKLDSAPNYDKRRKEISEAAARVFNRLGFRGTTISAVANELSIDRASLYYYISSKEELFDELVREVSDNNLAMAQKIQAGEGSPPEKLEGLILDLMAAYARSYPILYIYIRENLADVSDKRSKWAKYMKRVNHDYDAAVISIIEEGYSDGSFQYIGPARVVAFGILGMVGWTNRWFDPDTSVVSAAEIGRVYADLIINGLKSGNTAIVKKPAKIQKKKSPK